MAHQALHQQALTAAIPQIPQRPKLTRWVFAGIASVGQGWRSPTHYCPATGRLTCQKLMCSLYTM